MSKLRAPSDMLKTNTIVTHYGGSLAYGTNLPSSDVDIRGIFFTDKTFHLSPWHNCYEVEVPGGDTKYYELTKFMALLVDQNPNIVESLWVRMEDVIDVSDVYLKLRAAREDLLTSKCRYTYSGYAHEQLKRIRGHERWLNNPQPVEPPRQIDYLKVVVDFTDLEEDWVHRHREDHSLVPYGNNIFGLYPAYGRAGIYTEDGRYLLNKADPQPYEGQEPMAIIKFNHVEYVRALDNHTNYWQWKNNRNAARSALEEKFGYDTKHAMHLVRLLRTSYEIVTEGVVHVYRHDAKDLLAIREGKYSYDAIIEYADELQARLNDAYDRTTLRYRVDTNKTATLLAELLEQCWGKR